MRGFCAHVRPPHFSHTYAQAPAVAQRAMSSLSEPAYLSRPYKDIPNVSTLLCVFITLINCVSMGLSVCPPSSRPVAL